MRNPRILTTTIALFFTATLRAATFVWDGGSGVDSNLSTAANWNPDGAPPSNILTTDLLFSGAVRLTPNVSVAFSANSVAFNAGASAFTIGGFQLNLGTTGIANNSANAQSFTNLINFGPAAISTINAANGALSFTNAIVAPTSTLTVDGSFATSFANINAVPGATIVKQGTGTMTWAPNSAESGNVTVSAGTLTLAGTPSFSSTSTLAVNGTSVLNLTQSTVIDGGQLTRVSGAAVNLSAGKTLTIQNGGDAIFTGAFSNTTASTITVTGAGSTLSNTGSSLTFAGGSTTNVLAGGALSSTFGILIGSATNGAMTVDGAGSSLTTPGINLGVGGGSGSLTFTNGSTGSLGSLTLASGGAGTAGTLSIQSGSAVTANNITIASGLTFPTGTLTVDGVGSSLTSSGANPLTVGLSSGAASFLNVQNSGTFTSATGNIVVQQTGVVAIAAGTFNANGNVFLSGQMTRDAAGTFALAAGRMLTVQNGGDFIITGNYAPTTNAIHNVSGSGSTMTATGAMTFSNSSALNVSAGGAVTATSSMDVGNGTNGTVTVDGTGSSLGAGGSFIGAGGGTGSVTFSNTASGNYSTLVVAAANGGGTVNVQSGATLGVSGLFSIAPSGTSLAGTVTVTGAGSSITTTATTATIGAGSGTGTAVVNVNSGGIFTAGIGGMTVNATGTVSVNGGTFNANGSTTINGGHLVTATASPFTQFAGTLTVQGGGDATFGTTPVFGSATSVAVTGAGSLLRNTPGSGAGLAFNGPSISVSGGGVVTSDSILNIGIGASTVATVDGAGSALNASPSFINYWGLGAGTSTITFSNGATGSLGLVSLADSAASTTTLNVQSGAGITVTGLQVAPTSTTTGTINVGGTGSSLHINGIDLALGTTSGSTATLNITAGGTVTTNSFGGANNLILNPTGTVNLSGGALMLGDPILRNGGVLNFNSGLLSLDESLTVGAAGLLGSSLTLAANRQLVVPATQTTTVDLFNTLTLSGGSLSTGALANNGTIDFQKGTLVVTGAGGFNVGTGALGGNVTLGTGANLQVTNTTTIAAGALLRTDGGSFSSAGITNNGTIDHRDGTLNISGTLTNAASGRFFAGGVAAPAGAIANAGTITLQNGVGFLGGAGAITNTGLITGDGTIAKPVTNSATGQIRAEAGKTLTFTGAVAANAGTYSLQGGTLDFASAVTNSNTGFISGTGSLRTQGITNQGVIAISGGNGNIYGDVTNSAGARIITSGGATTTFFDDVIHNGTEIRTSAGGASVFLGAVSGAGPFTGTGTVYFEGDLRPGNSPAAVLYEGDLVLGSASSLTLEIGGLVSGTQYDHLNVGGALHADGGLVLALLGGFTPQPGDSFDLFDAGAFAGDFDSITAPALAGGNAWDFSALKTTGAVSVVPEPGVATLLLASLGLLGLRRRR